MTDDTLVNFGSEIKALGTTDDGAMKFGAWLVLYGDPQNTDATSLRDYFTKSTDFDIEDGDKTTVYWNHGLDPELKRRKLGTATLHMKDAGIWMEGILKARDEYEAKIQEMIKAGKLGASSGVPAHLVERKSVGNAHEIVLWPLGKDASLTHTPAEFRTSAHAIKTLSELMEEDEAAEEIKKYDPRQPRDDLGKWSTSSGGISVGHAIHVMKSEGITDEAHHAAVREAIENGTHKSREDVLKHIDAIHAQGKAPSIPDLPENHAALMAQHRKGDKNARNFRERVAENIADGRGTLDEVMGGSLPDDEKAMIGALVAQHHGYAYHPPEQGKEPRFVKNDEPFMPTSMAGWTTNTHMAILGDMPKGARNLAEEREGFQPPKLEKVMPQEDGQQIRPIAVGHSASGDVSVFTDTGTRINKKYLDFVMARYPDATLHQVQEPSVIGTGSSMRPILVKSKGKKVGIIMPMQNYRDSTPPVLRSSQKSLFADDEPESSDEYKSHNFTSPDEVVTAITDILRGRMPLEWHSQAVRATVKSLEERIAGVIDTRCVKSGRVLSCDNHERLSQHHAALQAVVEDLGALLEAHKPAAADDTDTKSLSDVESQQLMARYAATMARLNGVPLELAA